MVAVAIVAVGAIVAVVVLTLAFSRKRHADKPQMPVLESSTSPAEEDGRGSDPCDTVDVIR